MRTGVSAVPGTHRCDPQHWLGQMLYSQPAYCTTLIEQCVITMKGTVIGPFKQLLYWSQESIYYNCGQNRQ